MVALLTPICTRIKFPRNTASLLAEKPLFSEKFNSVNIARKALINL